MLEHVFESWSIVEYWPYLMLQKKNYSTIVHYVKCGNTIISMLCTWEESCFKDTAYLLKCSNVVLGENAVPCVVWVSQGCMDFKAIFQSTKVSSGQQLI